MKYDPRHLPHGDLHFPGAELPSLDEYLAERAMQTMEPMLEAIVDEDRRQQALKDMEIPAVYAFMRRLMPDWMFVQRYPELVRQ